MVTLTDEIYLDDTQDEQHPMDTELESFSQLQSTSRVLLVRGLQWVKTEYNKSFLSSVRKQVEEFENFDFISKEDKERIRPRVLDAIARVQAYQAWRSIIEELFTYLYITFAATPIISFIAVRSMIDFDWPWWASLGIVVLAFIIPTTIMITFVWLSDHYVPQKNSTTLSREHTRWLLFWSALNLLLAILVERARPEGVVLAYLRDVIIVGLVAGAMIFSLLIIFDFLHSLVYNWNERRKRNQATEDEFIQTLCFLLAYLTGEEDSQLSPSMMSGIVYQLEYLARLVEKNFYRSLRISDSDTNSWLGKRTGEMAAGIRKLKQSVLMPREGSREGFIQELAFYLTAAADGHWGLLEGTAPTMIRQRRQIAIKILRFGMALLFPIAIIAVLQLGLIELEEPTRVTITGAAAVWAFMNIAALVDPNVGQKPKNSLELANKLWSKTR